MLDNALESLRKVGVTNVAICPMDETSRDVLLKLATFGVVLDVPPFADPSIKSQTVAANFGAKSFQQLTESRPNILKSILKTIQVINNGQSGNDPTSIASILYSDVDTYFQHDPVPLFRDSALTIDYVPPKGSVTMDFNKHMAKSGFDAVAVFDGKQSNVCSCFMFFRATEGAFELLDKWTEEIDTGEFDHDQKALTSIYLRLRASQNVIPNSSFRIHPPDSPYLPCGMAFDGMTKDKQSEVVVVHNNWIIGHSNKLKRFQEKWNLWQPSGRLERLRYKCGEPGASVEN